jgi:hypothetical protein
VPRASPTGGSDCLCQLHHASEAAIGDLALRILGAPDDPLRDLVRRYREREASNRAAREVARAPEHRRVDRLREDRDDMDVVGVAQLLA